MKKVRIGKRAIGPDEPPFIVAEAGVNHNGDIALAKKLIDAAAKAGADAVKFQTFTPDELATDQAEQADYQRKNTGIGEVQAAMLKKLALPHQAFAELKKHADEKSIEFLSTPFGIRDADFLHSLGLAAFKISSGDLTNLPLLEHIARYRVPVLLSTGMATMDEIAEALDTLHSAGAEDIILLQCTSEYPTPLSHANLRAIATLEKKFDVPVGFSDHTERIEASVWAASLGACIIEKHLTLDRTLPGPDHRASLEPAEMKEMISRIRADKNVAVPEEALGTGKKIPFPEELAIARQVRKSVAARTDIAEGDTLTAENTFVARPEGFLPPKTFPQVLGRKAKRAIARGTALEWDMLE